MLFRNFTPFPPLQFESRDEKQNEFGVTVLRGTFQIESGKRLRLVQEQEPLVMADEYFGAPGESSLHFEASIAPYKPKTDVLLTATAHAPTGAAQSHWDVAVQIGDTQKQLTVTGPRVWNRSMGRHKLSEIQPVATVPIRYELAFGGSCRGGGDDRRVFEENPVGVGFTDSKNDEDNVRAPQILPHGKLDFEWGEVITPAGLGPIAPGWASRRNKAGTFNVIWEKTRWPDLPEDFSFDFYNTASSGLSIPFVKGDETIRLTNLSPDHQLSFSLPQFELASLLRFQDGRLIPAPINLDTIHIDVEHNRVYLTWRGVYPVNPPLRVLEVRLKAPHDVIDKSTARLNKDVIAEARSHG